MAAIDFPNSPTVGDTFAAAGKIWLYNGGAWTLVGVSTAGQNLDLKANLSSPTFTGTVTVPTPTNNTDAATKAYVDTEVAGAAVATLNDIGDVTITSAANSQFLRWDGTAWVNQPITTTQTRTNLCVNPSYEINTSSWFSGQSGGTVTRSTAESLFGIASGSRTMSSSEESNVFAIGFTFPTMGVYSFSAFFYVPAGSTLAGRTMTTSFEGGTAIGTISAPTAPTLAVDSWVRSSRFFTVTTTGTKFIVFRLSGTLSTAVGQTIFIDGALFEETNQLRPYFDGNGAEPYTDFTLIEGPVFTGTPNLSTSVATWAENSSVFLDDIGDVTITSVATGQLLQWNGTAWVNASFSSDLMTDARNAALILMDIGA